MSLNRQLSVMEGGSCPSSPQVKKACRLVVLGSTQTGKTSIVNRFLNDVFDDCYLPTIENFHRKLYRIHGEFYQLDILDTSGNDPFPAARRLSLLTGETGTTITCVIMMKRVYALLAPFRSILRDAQF